VKQNPKKKTEKRKPTRFISAVVDKPVSDLSHFRVKAGYGYRYLLWYGRERERGGGTGEVRV
jgi:hypothetical protein